VIRSVKAAGTGASDLAVRSPAAVRAARRAWLILWLALATFCVLLGSAIKYATEYVSTAAIDLPAQIETVRGHVFVQRPGGTTTLLSSPQIAEGALLIAERDSDAATASIRLFDQSRVTVQTGAQLELSRMQVGRFINQHAVLLRQLAGPVRYETVGPVDVQAPNGLVHLGGRGDVTLWIDGAQTRVLVYEGEARLEASGASVVVSRDQQATIGADRRISELGPRATQLLNNGDFVQHDDGWIKHDVPNGPLDVNGLRFWVSGPDDAARSLPALRIVRESVRMEHGETGLKRPLNLNVSGFRHLWLQAWVRVDGASLSGGGQLGSEYPMMLVMHYEGPLPDSRPDWTHGFYTSNPENRPVRDAEQWSAGTWKQYRVDLMDTEPSRLPYRLLDLQVMGQGHSYDARIADIQLIGE
jgi:hypothetical protein